MTLAVSPHHLPTTTMHSAAPGWAPTDGAGGIGVLSVQTLHDAPAEGEGNRRVSRKVCTELSARAWRGVSTLLCDFQGFHGQHGSPLPVNRDHAARSSMP